MPQSPEEESKLGHYPNLFETASPGGGGSADCRCAAGAKDAYSHERRPNSPESPLGALAITSLQPASSLTGPCR